MTHYQFFEFLQNYRKQGANPGVVAWPEKIELGKDFWKGIKDIHKYTQRDNYEYETSFFFADGDIVNSLPLKGDKHSVSAKHTLNVKYEPAKDNYFYKKIIVDGRVVKQKSVKANNLPQKIEAGFLLNAHTHPVYYLDKITNKIISFDEYRMQNRKNDLKHRLMEFLGMYRVSADDDPNLQKTYGFFSDTDINTFIHSSALLTGLVTNEFWLACKTDQSISQIGENGVQMLHEISKHTYSGEQYIESLIKEQMRDWGIVFYKADIGASLRKI